MKFKKFFQASALSLLITLSASASVPVLARGGSDDSGDHTASASTIKVEDNSTTGSNSGSGSSGSGKRTVLQSEVRVKSESETEVHKSGDDDVINEFRKKAEARVAELKKENKTQSAEKRQEKCQTRKHGLETKFSRITGNAQKMQTRIDSVLSKAVDYQQANNIQATDFDNLVVAAEAAKAKSAASIASLETLKPSIDCNNASVATDVAAFKAAAEQVRTDLKAYRTAAKAVLKSLLEATSTETESEGSGQ